MATPIHAAHLDHDHLAADRRDARDFDRLLADVSLDLDHLDHLTLSR